MPKNASEIVTKPKL